MGNKTRNIRYPEWIKKAVSEFAKKNGFENDSRAFIWLLSTQLNRYGYFEEKYTENMADKPLHNETPPPSGVIPFRMKEKVKKTIQKKAKKA
jgi:hypothetical protein